MTTLNDVLDAEALAVKEFKDEGAFLFTAERAAERLRTRLAGGRVFLSHDELKELSRALSRAVAIASEYHLGAAEIDG